MNSIRARLLALLTAIILSAGLVGTVGDSTAHAMTPNQTALAPTINTLYWKLDAFWRMALNNPNYKSPTIGYYSASPTYVAACGYLYDYTIMAACSGGQIWIGSPVNQDKINRLGDYAAGFFLAHEWGHHIANTLGLRFPTIRGRELYADCMAGVFTKYGYSYGKYLDASDYWEGYNSLGDRFPNEGGASNGYPPKADRKAWYQWGFTQYNLGSCAQAVNQ